MVPALPTGYRKLLVFHVLPRLLNERDAIVLPRVQQDQDLSPDALHSQQ